MKQKIKKYLKYTLIGIACFIVLGIFGSLLENWEVVPPYTPKSFLSDVKRAEELNVTNHLPVEVHSSDTTYGYSYRRGGTGRGTFSRPTLCSQGTLYQDNTSRSSIRCNKSFVKHYELADTAKQTFDHAVQSIESENWVRSGSPEDYNKNFATMVAKGTGVLSFKNDRLNLYLRARDTQECIKDNLNEFFCDKTKPGVASFVTVTITADYSDF